MTYRISLSALAAVLLSACAAWSADWITAPSYYTHDPMTGERVDQYSPIGPFYTYSSPDFMRSGYRHYRSSIEAGGSADNMHIVEEWGRPVRPYGEWRFPYRPYSVPYPAWGPPFAGWGNGAYYPYAPQCAALCDSRRSGRALRCSAAPTLLPRRIPARSQPATGAMAAAAA